MCKNIMISLQAGYILSGLPCFEIRNYGEKMATIVGIATAVFIFLLFLEDLGDKYRIYRKRVRKTRQIVKDLQKGRQGDKYKAGLYRQAS